MLKLNAILKYIWIHWVKNILLELMSPLSFGFIKKYIRLLGNVKLHMWLHDIFIGRHLFQTLKES